MDNNQFSEVQQPTVQTRLFAEFRSDDVVQAPEDRVRGRWESFIEKVSEKYNDVSEWYRKGTEHVNSYPRGRIL